MARLQFVREHTVHGTITGIQRIQTIETMQDGLDRLLISFADAKVRTEPSLGAAINTLRSYQVSLLEWSSDFYDLVDISLHTFEKLPQIVILCHPLQDARPC